MLNKVYIKCKNFIENDIILIIINYIVCADTSCSKYGKFQLTNKDLQGLPSFEKNLYNRFFYCPYHYGQLLIDIEETIYNMYECCEECEDYGSDGFPGSSWY